MIKLSVVFFALLSSLFLNAQSLEFSIGGGRNLLSTTENHYRVSEFKYGNSYALGISLDEIAIDTLPPLKFTLSLEYFNGEYYVSNFSPGGGSSVRANFNNYAIGVTGYPLNFVIARKIDLNLGIQVSYVFDSEVDGIEYKWVYLSPSQSLPLENDAGKFIVGFNGGVNYNFNISKQIYLFPQYDFYFSFEAIRSTRHHFGIGFGKRLKE